MLILGRGIFCHGLFVIPMGYRVGGFSPPTRLYKMSQLEVLHIIMKTNKNQNLELRGQNIE